MGADYFGMPSGYVAPLRLAYQQEIEENVLCFTRWYRHHRLQNPSAPSEVLRMLITRGVDGHPGAFDRVSMIVQQTIIAVVDELTQGVVSRESDQGHPLVKKPLNELPEEKSLGAFLELE